MQRLRRVRAVLVGCVVTLLVLVVVAAGLVTWTVRRSFPDVDGALTLPGLTAPVTVHRDAWGVPQLYADDALDLFRAQGFVHAQDRFWQMDVRRHATAGRLAEIFGRSQLRADAVVRTLGWRRVVEQELALLSPRTVRYLEAYAEGVNAYLAQRGGARLSLEYAVLGVQNRGYEPEPWAPVDSLSWLKAMAWDLRGNMQAEIERSLLLPRLSPRRIEELWPPYPYGRHRPILASGEVVGGEFRTDAEPTGPDTGASVRGLHETLADPRVGRTLRAVQAALDHVPALLGRQGGGLGSNSWVVAGSRTASGAPLLANDTHLAPAVPSPWYQMGLHCRAIAPECPFDVGGVTFAGVPGVIIGHNADIAWGFTNLDPDVSDLYLEKLRGNRYLYDGRLRPLDVRTETISVAGEEPVHITVRSSRHGPLLSDVDDELRDVGRLAPARRPGAPARGDGYAVSLQWTALTPGRTADAIFALNRARSWPSFRAAARLFAVPSQNLVYADTAGHIGYQAPGQIPVRRTGDGQWPAPGWTSAYGWAGYVPFAALPTSYDPPEGFLVTANNAVTFPGYPFFLSDEWAYGYRSQRITRLVTAGGGLDVPAMERIQRDTRNGFAPTLVPHLLGARVDDFTGEAQELLRGWDYTQPAGSAAAAYYNAVWANLLRLTFRDEIPDRVRIDGGGRWFEVVRRLLRRPEDRWWDDVTTPRAERRDEVIAEAMTQARLELTRLLAKDVGRWSWGRLHSLELRHQTLGRSGVGPVEALFNRGPFELAGGSSVVDATGWTPSDGYAVTSAPSMRMVVDLGDLDASRWVNLTGASGHAFSEHYTDQSPLWRDGRTIRWRWRAPSVADEAEYTLTLRP